ncbi:MAG: type II toxin-antitoxin system PemK/MazF family toxin [Gemmatimonadota bacterium]|nr:type II toxin-antitoxin system PemK/MazF family toxin [Gemmatimonadota bacterium]
MVLDQLRTVDRSRLVRRVGSVSAETVSSALEVLRAMFDE